MDVFNMVSRQPVHNPKRRYSTTSCDTIFKYALTNFVLDPIQQKMWIELGVGQNVMRNCKLVQFYCVYFHLPQFGRMMWVENACCISKKKFHLSLNLKIYRNFDLNHPVAYFPFRNLYTFCKAANQNASVKWCHISVIFARTIFDFL